MLPSFPSVTFPNHYTLVTGLYPESHGVVGNSFWDPDLLEEFYYTDPARSMQPKWWLGGEPLWSTAEKQNCRSAIHMWPGSEAHMQQEPTFIDKFDGQEKLYRKVDRILGLLDLPGASDGEFGSLDEQRPQFIAAYVPNVDVDGHLFGPNSTEIRTTISNVDSMLQSLFAGLEDRNLTDIVNIVIVSDHGLATTSTDRIVQLEDLIDIGLIEHIDGWPLYGLRPKNSADLQSLYGILSKESKKNPNFEVYLRDENMPERYHFSKNDRIAPLWIIPKTGWAIVHKEDFDLQKARQNGETYHPRGLHGYDHENPLMRAIFVARGPAFPHTPNSRLEVFRKFESPLIKCFANNRRSENTEVYNIVCDSLGIEPRPNNGTLRLPLNPIGLHSDPPTTSEDEQEDYPTGTADDKQMSHQTKTEPALDPTSSMIVEPSIGVEVPQPLPSRPVIADGNSSAPEGEENNEETETSNWWDSVMAKIEAAKAWANGVIDKWKGKSDETDE